MNAPASTRLPEFVVLGQGKAGTSLIYRVLNDNPLIGLSDPKELHYFAARFGQGPDWYASHFAHIPGSAQIVGEVSPSYLSTEAVQRVADTLGRQTKVIFVLRRPIEQAYSRYLQDICANQRPGPFYPINRALPKRMEALIDAIGLCYDLFGKDNVLPMFYERDIACDDPQFESRILSFLGLPEADFARPYIEGKPVNPGIMPRYLYSGDKGLRMDVNGHRFILPPRQLVFCGQKRNSWSKADPSAEEVIDALTRQSTWTPAISERDYRGMRRRAVRPTAERLETLFGYDMSHWEVPPRHIAYDPAPPPNEFRKIKGAAAS